MPRKPDMWKMANGSEKPIREMADSHILNAVRYFRRNARQAMQQCHSQGMAVASCISGEIASDSIESDLRELEDMDEEKFLERTIPNWNRLLNESKRRGLNP